MECLVQLETFLNSAVFLFISYWIIQNGISICRLKLVLNSVKKTAHIAMKAKLISLLDEVSISLLKLSQSIGSAITYILLNFWFKRAMRLQMRPYDWIACERQMFLLAHRRWGKFSQGGTSATQRQKFHTDDINQCLHNKSGSHGVPNANLFNFTFLLVDFGKVLCSSANELQQNSNASSREDYIPQILAVLLEIHRVYIWPLWPFVFCLSFVNNS